MCRSQATHPRRHLCSTASKGNRDVGVKVAAKQTDNQAAKFEMAINVSTAQRLGPTIFTQGNAMTRGAARVILP